MADPVIIPPTCQILCTSPVPPVDCLTAYFHETLEADFTVPAVTGTADVAVCFSTQYAIGSYLWILGAGIFQITSLPTTTSLRVRNNGETGNAVPTSLIAAGVVIAPVPPPERTRWLEGSAVWDPTAIADGNEIAQEIVVTGAALGDFVLVSFSLDVADLALVAAVTAADTVTASLLNNTGGSINLGSGTVRARVLPM